VVTETAWAEDLKGNNVLTESAEGLEGCEEFTEPGFGGSEKGFEACVILEG